MSESLEALYRLATRNNGNRRSDEEVDNDFKIVEKALKDYESIDNANPSEALKQLNIIGHLEIGFDKNGNPLTVGMCNGFDTIKQALIQTELDREELDKYRLIKRAVKDGIWTIDLLGEKLKFHKVRLSNVETEWYFSNDEMCVNIKDYNKTWWLKEDKSE